MNNITEKKINEVLNLQKEVCFAYLYGSYIKSKKFRDIDIAVYLRNKWSFGFIADLKIRLSKVLNISPDMLDVRVINDILNNPDAFSLLYLERIFKEGKLIINKDFDSLGNFLEKFNNKYREAVALLDEVK